MTRTPLSTAYPRGNLYKVDIAAPLRQEQIDTLLQAPGFSIERIISAGHISQEGFWYEQHRDEWVVLLQGEAELEVEGEGLIRLLAGDYIFLPNMVRHRVSYTSVTPPCIWLAIYVDPVKNTGS